MIDINLESNESVLVKVEGIRFDMTGSNKGKGDLLLTNKRIVITRKGMFGKTKETITVPKSDIKKYEGRPQVKYNEKTAGAEPKVDIYTARKNIEVTFSMMQKKDAKNFVYEVHKLICSEEDFAAWRDENKFFAMNGPEDFMKAVAGTIDDIKEAVHPPVPGSAICKTCGGLVQGYIGKTAKCTFCGNQQMITEE